MLKLRYSSQFKKDLKLAKKQGKNILKVKTALELLVKNHTLPSEYNDHMLTGNWKSFHECHIEPDWLLIYRINNDILELVAQRLGSHSELFKK